MISKEILKNYFRVSDEIGAKANLGGLDRYMEDSKGYRGYVVVKPARLDFVDPSDYGVQFIGNGRHKYKGEEVVDALLKINSAYELRDLVFNVEDTKDMVEDMKDYFEDEIELYEDLNELKEDLVYELVEFYIDNGYEGKFISDNGCYLDSVGYSQWSDFIAKRDVKKSFVRDMWEGWNWYNIRVIDLEGNEFDYFGDNHFEDKEDIEDVIVNEFGLSDYKIVITDEV